MEDLLGILGLGEVSDWLDVVLGHRWRRLLVVIVFATTFLLVGWLIAHPRAWACGRQSPLRVVGKAKRKIRELVVLFNTSSGDRLASRLKQWLTTRLDGDVVIHAFPMTSTDVPAAMRCLGARVEANKAGEVVLLVLGGDGSVCWAVGALAVAGLSHVPMAMLPCGSGNDASTSVGWGRTLDESLFSSFGAKRLIEAMEASEEAPLDVWEAVIRVKEDGKMTRVQGSALRHLKGSVLRTTFLNYCSIGLDALLTARAEAQRTPSRIGNRLVFCCEGLRRVNNPGPTIGSLLSEAIIDGQSVSPSKIVHPKSPTMVFLSGRRYGGGCPLWSIASNSKYFLDGGQKEDEDKHSSPTKHTVSSSFDFLDGGDKKDENPRKQSSPPTKYTPSSSYFLDGGDKKDENSRKQSPSPTKYTPSEISSLARTRSKTDSISESDFPTDSTTPKNISPPHISMEESEQSLADNRIEIVSFQSFLQLGAAVGFRSGIFGGVFRVARACSTTLRFHTNDSEPPPQTPKQSDEQQELFTSSEQIHAPTVPGVRKQDFDEQLPTTPKVVLSSPPSKLSPPSEFVYVQVDGEAILLHHPISITIQKRSTTNVLFPLTGIQSEPYLRSKTK